MIERLFGKPFNGSVSRKDLESLGMMNVSGLLIPFYVAAVQKVTGSNLIWITGENENTEILKSDFIAWSVFLNNLEVGVHVHGLPWEDPYINNVIAPEKAGEKARLLSDIKESKKVVIITTLAALSIQLELRKESHLLIRTLRVGDRMGSSELIQILNELGYHAGNRVENDGDYGFHGSIIDFFPAGLNYPYRVKFNENRIESIKRFHPVSQISIEAVSSVTIAPTLYFETTKSKNTEIFYLTDYLKDYMIIAADYEGLKAEYHKLLKNFDTMYSHHQADSVWPKVSEIFTLPIDRLEIFPMRTYSGSDEGGDGVGPRVIPKPLTFLSMAGEEFLNEPEKAYVFCCGNRLKEQAVRAKFKNAPIIQCDIPVSLYFPERKEYFISYLGREGNELADGESNGSQSIFDDMEPGDYVVHKSHGIGRFSGFKQLDMNGEKGEFLTITYQDDARIYVPVHELEVLSKYVGFMGQEPVLDKIGGSTWESKKREAQKSMISFARELLDLYAMRKAVPGHSFMKQPEIENVFTSGFSFVETRDQKSAIKEVLSDLEAPFPMDRLICGDVSFGKTEIALRAAIRVVSCGKQVAVLCPTTVLAYQHYETFKKRFASFPYRVEYLTRNVSQSERKEILQSLASGDTHIIIGTHALLSQAVEFKNPGLFIIDEEQRFGVFQKEKLKKGREYVDVLSLSATPIPRTLSFTIAGLQDVSIINTPPVGRKAVKNYIGPYSDDLVFSALDKEINRNGQAFIIYNNIEGIYAYKEKLQTLMPGIRFALIHARMDAEEIEETVFKFINREADVLISTTIIENGIDIPNVNTLIIINAHLFGLTQLYQLRGRIGRGTRQGYTYFLHSDDQGFKLSEKADKRLEAIREFAQLGSGYRVAEFDLKMRGAGSLLGNKQHGHIEALGFDYFLGLLKKTISELRGESREIQETIFTIQFSVAINDRYIPDVQERVSIYKRIPGAATADELLELKAEIEDRYGECDSGLLRAFFAQSMKLLARYFEFAEVELSLEMAEITLRPVYDEKKEKLSEFLALSNARITTPTTLILEYPDYSECMEMVLLFLLET